MHDLNPFNHGTTSIIHEVLPSAQSALLEQILENGWRITAKKLLRLSAGAEKNSNNYRAETEEKNYLLKQSHINNPKTQLLVNQCVDYLREENIAVPRIIPSIDGNSFYSFEGKLFCLYDFIEGEHFDGSQQELKNMAQETARLHKVLAGIPYNGEIKRTNGIITAHNRELLTTVIQKIREHGSQSNFDNYILNLIGKVDEYSKAIVQENIQELPSQVIHYDLHPHNVLFDGDSKKLLAILDFDPLRYSQRVRDIGFGMHRFARTCGLQTERKNSVGVDIRRRAHLFLEVYNAKHSITDKEMKLLPLVLQDEALTRITGSLVNHYIKDDATWSFDLPKQFTMLEEGGLFSF